MSKPDDIPQDVWDAAREVFAGNGRAGEYDETLRIYERIARAILPLRQALDQIEAIASGSRTANSLPHIAKIAQAALAKVGDA